LSRRGSTDPAFQPLRSAKSRSRLQAAKVEINRRVGEEGAPKPLGLVFVKILEVLG